MTSTGDAITIAELLQRIDAACERMSAHSEGRRTLQQCRVAIEFLTRFVPKQERSPGGIILP